MFITKTNIRLAAGSGVALLGLCLGSSTLVNHEHAMFFEDPACEEHGCKTQLEVATDLEGGSNTCGVAVIATVTPNPDYNLDGRCVCDGSECVRVGEHVCRAIGTASVTVTQGSGYIFCSNQSWTVVGNVATIELDSGTIACDGGEEGVDAASMFVQCHASCYALALNTSAWVLGFAVRCFPCADYSGSCP